MTITTPMTSGLWDAQVEAIQNLEQSFADDRPRALIQVATGSGEILTAVTEKLNCRAGWAGPSH